MAKQRQTQHIDENYGNATPGPFIALVVAPDAGAPPATDNKRRRRPTATGSARPCNQHGGWADRRSACPLCAGTQ